MSWEKNLLEEIKKYEIKKGEYKFTLVIKRGKLEFPHWNYHFLSTKSNKQTPKRIVGMIHSKLGKLKYQFPSTLKMYKDATFKIKLIKWQPEKK